MPNVSDGQVNGSNIIYQKSLESKYSIDVSVEDASEYKSQTEKSHRAPSLKSPSKGKRNLLNQRLIYNLMNIIILGFL